jgi:hypothetical protein
MEKLQESSGNSRRTASLQNEHLIFEMWPAEQAGGFFFTRLS